MDHQWDIGFGLHAAVIEADTEEEARKAAYEAAREDFENNADYKATPYSQKYAEDVGAE